MAHKPRSSKATGKAAPRETPIERDATFVRIGADDVIPVLRRRDYQLSFLARGQEPAAFAPSQESKTPGATAVQPILIKGGVYELARVTLPHSQAFTLAMRIIDNEVSDGRRTADFVRLAIEGMLAEIQDDQTADEVDDEDDEDRDA